MRKDVILGMSIGGVLLAIVVVYLLIAPGSKPKGNGVDLGAGPVAEAGGDQADTPTTQPSADPSKALTSDTLHDSGHAAYQSGVSQPGKTPDPTKSHPASHIGGSVVIAKTPEENRSLRANTPSDSMLAGVTVTHTPFDNPGVGAPADPVQPIAAAGSGSASTPAAETPAKRTHVVQKGETLSSIAAVAYGSANFYPYILRANPTLNPNRMRPGTTITLPDVAEVRPPQSGAATTADAPTTRDSTGAPVAHVVSMAANVDPTREYVVQSGDSLHRIAIKLYGKIGMVDKIYDLNKESIGPDKARLKLHMVLKLPQPPIVVAASQQ